MKRILAFILALAMTLTLFCGVSIQSASAETLIGIDVSEHQQTIDWKKVKAAGVDFAILRGWCYGKDKKFEENYAGAKAAGIPVGVYCYTYGLTQSEITAEMNSLITECLAGKQFEYPIYVDMECTTYVSSVTGQTVYGYDTNSKATNAALMTAACNVLENAGYFAGMYTYTSFINSYLDMTNLANRYTMWIADYRTNCGYTGPYDMWQYSSTGSVNGISGNVDMNYCYRTDFESIMKTVGLNGYQPSTTYPYKNNDGSLMLYDGEYTTPASTDFYTSLSLSTQKTQGNKSLKMTYTKPNEHSNSNKIGGMTHIIINKAADLTGYSHISFDLYLPTKMSGSHGFQLNFATDNQDGYNSMTELNEKGPGWINVTMEKKKIGMAKETDWAKINRLRLTWFNYSGVTNETYFLIDNIRAHNVVEEPTIDAAVQKVIDAIAALPGNITLNNKAAVQSARTDYNALTNAQKALVTNLATLTAAEKTIDDLEAKAADKAAADAVVSMFAALPAAADVQESHRGQIVAAKGAYDALTDAQKAMVSNVQKLIDVINALNALPVVDVAVQEAIAAIEQLPAADQVTAEDAAVITAAKDKYDALTAEQKNQVTNAEKLTKALAALQAATVQYGDIEEDGDVDANDALVALKYSVGKATLTDSQFKAGEVNKDNKVDAADALLILKKVVGKLQLFPVEE